MIYIAIFLICVAVLYTVQVRLVRVKKMYTNKTYADVDELSRQYINREMYIDENKLFSKKDMDKNVQQEGLLLLKDFFEKHDIKYIIDCGTLLGAVRDGNFIDGDTDADLSIDNYQKVVDNLNELEDLGFLAWRVGIYDDLGMSLLRKGEFIDLFMHIPLNIEITRIPFLGSMYPIPKHYDEWLTEIYGNWRIPRSDKSGKQWDAGMPNYMEKYRLF